MNKRFISNSRVYKKNTKDEEKKFSKKVKEFLENVDSTKWKDIIEDIKKDIKLDNLIKASSFIKKLEESIGLKKRLIINYSKEKKKDNSRIFCLFLDKENYIMKKNYFGFLKCDKIVVSNIGKEGEEDDDDNVVTKYDKKIWIYPKKKNIRRGKRVLLELCNGFYFSTIKSLSNWKNITNEEFSYATVTLSE